MVWQSKMALVKAKTGLLQVQSRTNQAIFEAEVAAVECREWLFGLLEVSAVEPRRHNDNLRL
jgi:hypothetical protein